METAAVSGSNRTNEPLVSISNVNDANRLAAWARFMRAGRRLRRRFHRYDGGVGLLAAMRR